MALTLANVRQFRSYLKDLEVITDELLKARERSRIFNNSEEMEEAKTCAIHCPQDYFKFQLFNFYIELNKDKRGYYVYAENYTPRSAELLKLRKDYSNQYRINTDNFDEVKTVFQCFCVDMIHQFFNTDNNLIYIY